jgi:hypothetical protein
MLLSFDVGIKNMAYALLEKDERIVEWATICLSGKGIHDISDDIIKKFNELFLSKYSDIDITDVVIENQPCFKAPTMKSIQMVVFTYFKILYPKTRLHFCSAKNKLSLSDKDCKKMNYNERKKESIVICESMKGIEADFKDMFAKSKKKDDLADALLQGIYFIRAFQHI